ncbi:MAG: hypothetical protein KatS3mg011_1746 [Acidimicrobiia bacterium]|nr:MAG: hypothetical protein KatS3mg011_1746 [Acidimicrobiia bacterium]
MFEILIRDSELGRHIATQVRENRVGQSNQVFQDLSSPVSGDIKDKASFVAIERLEEEAVLAFLERRNVAADITPGRRVFDFNHLSTEVSKVH